MKQIFRLTIIFLFAVLLIVPASQLSGKDNKASYRALDLTEMDLTVSPRKDFYQYSNGGWLKKNPLRGAYSRWSNFHVLQDLVLEQLKVLLEGAAADTTAADDSISRKIGNFYVAGMDEASIEKQGLKPLEPELKRIASLEDTSQLPQLTAHLQQIGVTGPFIVSASQDPKDSNTRIAFIRQGGLGLPDRDYYIETDKRSKEIRVEYLRHQENMFVLSGESKEQAAASAKKVVALETRLAKASMTRVQRRDPKAKTNRMSLEELKKLTPHFDFGAFFAAVGHPNHPILNVSQPDLIREVNLMVKEIPAEQWRAYFKSRLLNRAARYLGKAFDGETFRFFGIFLRGNKKMRPRWQRIIRQANAFLGEPVGRLYVKKHFPPEAKTRAYTLVMNLKKAFAERIKKLDWMGEVTRKKALEKLEAFGVKIGYPDKWKDYSALEQKRDSYVLNYFRIRRFDFQRRMGQIGQPVDKAEWGIPPQMVNAFYSSSRNEICFPAGILQPPFFDFKADDALNYGAIGAAIGHEMTHGFDDGGRNFDKDGNLNDWWTKKDSEEFKKRTDVLVKQADSHVVFGDLRINGKLTLGENIADLGGLSISYDALMQTLPPRPEKIDGLTQQQRFFIGWARAWRLHIRKEAQALRIKTDVHPPATFRVFCPLSNLPTFHKAFGLKPGDYMYKEEKDRANIW